MKNTIKVILTEFGGIQVVSIPLKLYKESYNTTQIECFIPKLNNTKSVLKMYASGRDNLGQKVWSSQTYNLVYTKDVLYNHIEYEVYTAKMPQEFCKNNGHIEITFTHMVFNEQDTVESLLTSGTVNLYIDGMGSNNAGVAISPYDITASKVNALVQDMHEVKDWTAVDIPLLKAGKLPYENVQEALNTLEQEKANRKQVDRELERLEGKLDTGIDQEEVERNVVKAVLPLINRETIGIDKVDNTADMDKPVSILQQEAITRATNIAKAEITESFKQNLQAGLVALNDSLTGEIAKKEESLTEKITAEQTARTAEDTSIKNSITAMQEELQAKDISIEVLQAKDTSIEAQLQAMQAEIEALRSSSGGFIKSKQEWLDLTYPVQSYYSTANKNFNPNVAWGGVWYKMPANAVLWSYGDVQVLFATITINGKQYQVPIKNGASLPNITGTLKNVVMNRDGFSITGAFGNNGTSQNFGVGGNVTVNQSSVSFNASKSSTVYGANGDQNIVQPNNHGAYIWYRVA